MVARGCRRYASVKLLIRERRNLHSSAGIQSVQGSAAAAYFAQQTTVGPWHSSAAMPGHHLADSSSRFERASDLTVFEFEVH